MFERIRYQFHCLKGSGGNFNVSNDSVEIPIFKRIRLEFQYVKG